MEHITQQKDQQIKFLNQKISLLDKQLGQLSAEQQQSLESIELANQQLEEKVRKEKEENKLLKKKLDQSFPHIDLAKIKTEIVNKIGYSTWNRLTEASKKELCNSYSQYQLINFEGFTAKLTDYTAAALGLCLVAEREIISLFFKELYHFLSSNSSKASSTGHQTFEVGGVIVKPKGKYTLGSLPSLLASQWQAFDENVLEQENRTPNEKLYRTFFSGNKVSITERQLIEEFLQQWQHPLSKWLSRGEFAASVVDQIRQIRNRVSHPKSVYRWQFRILQVILIGGGVNKGILQEIYDS